MFNIQHDVGKWCTEYTYSAEDGMCGIKLLHNFGKLGGSLDTSEESDVSSRQPPGVKRVDEEEPIEGGLKGRVSLGAELYFSAKEKSAGGWSYISLLYDGILTFTSSVDRDSFYNATRCNTPFASNTVFSISVS